MKPIDFPIWQTFSQNLDETVIVLATPRKYQYGTSYNDAMAYGQLCAVLQGVPQVYPPDFLRANSQKNLIVIGGRLTNSIMQDCYDSEGFHSGFWFEAGVLYDKERYVALTPEFSEGSERIIVNTRSDYGLIVYTNNPFNRKTRLSALVGTKSAGTLGCAMALSEPEVVSEVLRYTGEMGLDRKVLLEKTLEIVVKVGAINGAPQRSEINVQKIRISNDAGQTEEVWESEEYKHKTKTQAYLLYVDINDGNIPHIRVNQINLQFRSRNRMHLIALLAKRAKSDYEEYSGNDGWISSVEIGRRLWPGEVLTDKDGWGELAPEVLELVSKQVVTWSKKHNITSRRDGTQVKMDSSYVSDEILIDLLVNIRRSVRDLVFNINKDIRKRKILPFPLIEGGTKRGYRLNTDPRCIFMEEQV